MTSILFSQWMTKSLRLNRVVFLVVSSLSSSASSRTSSAHFLAWPSVMPRSRKVCTGVPQEACACWRVPGLAWFKGEPANFTSSWMVLRKSKRKPLSGKTRKNQRNSKPRQLWLLARKLSNRPILHKKSEGLPASPGQVLVHVLGWATPTQIRNHQS